MDEVKYKIHKETIDRFKDVRNTRYELLKEMSSLEGKLNRSTNLLYLFATINTLTIITATAIAFVVF